MHAIADACFNFGGGGVQGFRLKSRDFCQPVQGSDLSRLASMIYINKTLFSFVSKKTARQLSISILLTLYSKIL